MNKTVLVIGSGPIVIGQSAEFDYAGVQALIALREAGYKTVVLNSNPATIMTDNMIADRIYIEPITLEIIEEIITVEKIDFILPTFGGQTGLNMAYKIYESKLLEKYGVLFLGIDIKTIKLAEDRKLFAEFLKSIGEKPIESEAFTDIKKALKFAKKIQFPVMIRSAFTLGGSGSGIVNNEEEFLNIANVGLNVSAIGQILVEKSIYGWKEIEYEIIRDSNGTCIAICNMENIDPVGIHTGESIVVTPSQTLDDKTYHMLRSLSIKIVENLNVQGACNVQLAVSQDNNQYYVIEVNPRLSRSSALASKATGYPIAKIAANIAIGKNLHEMKNFITKNSSAACEPVIDYVVLKIPKWNFEKLRVTDKTIGTQMKSTGEVMSIDSSFEGALIKGMITLYGDKIFDLNENNIEDLLEKIKIPNADRLLQIISLLKLGVDIDKIYQNTSIHQWFLQKIKNIADVLVKIDNNNLDSNDINKALKYGIQKHILKKYITKNHQELPYYNYKKVDSCSAEFSCYSNYLYSSYNTENEIHNIDKNSVVVIGSGPIAIGQGIEFDYSCVHTINELKNAGYKTIVLNNNPETLSTDFDVADYLLFEPMSSEYLMNIIHHFKPMGIIFQCGGQMALKIAFDVKKNHFSDSIHVLGTNIQSMIDVEDRFIFQQKIQEIDILYPKNLTIYNENDIANILDKITYPIIARPSFVIGGKGIQIIYNDLELKQYVKSITDEAYPVVLDEYINGLEVEIDAASDGNNVFIPAILQHTEESGVHSGDSIAFYPDNLETNTRDEILKITQKICQKFQIVGFVNIQFIIQNNKIYTIEVNPRASRTIPMIMKITGINIIKMAVECMLGVKIEQSILLGKKDIFATKVPVFSTHKIPTASMNLSAEMKSTGEVMGIGKSPKESMFKGMLAAGYKFNKHQKLIIFSENLSTELLERLQTIFKKIVIYTKTDLQKMNIELQSSLSDDILYNCTKKEFNFNDIGKVQYFSNTKTFSTYVDAYQFYLDQINIL